MAIEDVILQEGTDLVLKSERVRLETESQIRGTLQCGHVDAQSYHIVIPERLLDSWRDAHEHPESAEAPKKLELTTPKGSRLRVPSELLAKEADTSGARVTVDLMELLAWMDARIDHLEEQLKSLPPLEPEPVSEDG